MVDRNGKVILFGIVYPVTGFRDPTILYGGRGLSILKQQKLPRMSVLSNGKRNGEKTSHLKSKNIMIMGEMYSVI